VEANLSSIMTSVALPVLAWGSNNGWNKETNLLSWMVCLYRTWVLQTTW